MVWILWSDSAAVFLAVCSIWLAVKLTTNKSTRIPRIEPKPVYSFLPMLICHRLAILLIDPHVVTPAWRITGRRLQHFRPSLLGPLRTSISLRRWKPLEPAWDFRR